MNKDLFRNLLLILITLSLLFGSVVYPPQAYARINLRKFGRFLRRTTRFIITLPDRSTRWMGPVIGPIASFVLTKNIMKNPRLAKVIRRAGKAEKVLTKAEDIHNRLQEVRKMYRDEAKKLRDKSTDLVEARKQLAKDLLKHGDIDKYMEQVADMQQLIETHNEAADKFDRAANNLGTDDVIKMVSEDFLKAAWVDVRNAVLMETSKELSKVTDPKIIMDFVKGGGVDSVVDYLVDRELNKTLSGGDEEKFDKDKLKKNIKTRVEEELKKNKKLFKENWEDKINEIIKEQMKEMEKQKEELSEQEKKITGESDDKNIGIDELAPSGLTDEQNEVLNDFKNSLEKAIEDDNEKALAGEINETPPGKCPAGYVYRPHWGVDCVQVNCTTISDAHYSSTGRCICGSAGSIAENPEDPNKVCGFPQSYKSCPSCVYACVHVDEKCPLEGATF